MTTASVRFSTSRFWASTVLALALGLALAACGGSDSVETTVTPATTGAPEMTVVHVALTETDTTQGVDADLTVFQAGVPYHFVVENTGTRAHELMIIEPLEPGTMDMEAMDEMALFVVEEDDLEAGNTYEFDYTFPADAVGQSLEFACYLEGHYEAGMHATITVEG